MYSLFRLIKNKNGKLFGLILNKLLPLYQAAAVKQCWSQG